MAPGIFLRLLEAACDRLYATRVSIVDDLRRNAAATLYRVSAQPEAFGNLRAELDDEGRRQAICDVIRCAKAYLAWTNKLERDRVIQFQLPLES